MELARIRAPHHRGFLLCCLGTRDNPKVPLLTLKTEDLRMELMPVGDLGQLCCSIHNWSIRDRWRVEKPLINTSFQNVPIPNKSPSSDQHPGRAGTGWQQCQCP